MHFSLNALNELLGIKINHQTWIKIAQFLGSLALSRGVYNYYIATVVLITIIFYDDGLNSYRVCSYFSHNSCLLPDVH